MTSIKTSEEFDQFQNFTSSNLQHIFALKTSVGLGGKHFKASPIDLHCNFQTFFNLFCPSTPSYLQYNFTIKGFHLAVESAGPDRSLLEINYAVGNWK